MEWIFLETIDCLDSWVQNGYNKWNGCIQVHTNIGHLYLKNIRGGRPNITVGPTAFASHADAAPGYTLKFASELDCMVENLVLEGFPKDEQDDVVEILYGNQGGKGEIKNLIFQ